MFIIYTDVLLRYREEEFSVDENTGERGGCIIVYRDKSVGREIGIAPLRQLLLRHAISVERKGFFLSLKPLLCVYNILE